MSTDEFFEAYVQCALWTSHDETDSDAEYLDFNYNQSDIDEATLYKMRMDCHCFVIGCSSLMAGNWSQAGHDFWLTRNGHGAGFWDREPTTYGTEENRDRLDWAARSHGGFDLYVGEDGKIHGTR